MNGVVNMPDQHPVSMRKQGVTATLALVTIAAVTLYLCYRVAEPFLIPLLWGACVTIVFWPINARLRRYGPRWLGAGLSTVLVFLLLIAPTTYLGAALIDEVSEFTRQLQAGTHRAELDQIIHFENTPLFRKIAERLSPWIDLSGLHVKSLLLDNLKRLTAMTVDRTAEMVANFSVFLLHLGVVTLTMFFLFRDGDRLLNRVREALPLTAARTEELFTQLRQVVRAALYGGVLIAVIQGSLGGLAFLVLGLGAPVLWGVVMGFCSFFPAFGAALVYVPAAIFLLVQGSVGKGIILLCLGFGVVSTIDNLLRPMFISGRTRVHTLVLFISILGGLNVFGLLGLVMGPVLAAIFISFFNFYVAEMRRIRALVEAPPTADSGS